MASKQLVLALFEDEAAADVAAQALENWAQRTGRAKISATGVMVKDEKGKIKTHKLGHSRAAGGAVLFGLAALLTGGTAVGLGLVGGTLVGAGVGSLFHKGLKMSDEDKERLNQELDGGKAAVGVMVDPEEAGDVATELVALGGQTGTYEVTEEAIEEVQSVVQEMPEEPEEKPAEDES